MSFMYTLSSHTHILTYSYTTEYKAFSYLATQTYLLKSFLKQVLFVGSLCSDVTEDGLKTFIARLSTSSPSMTVAISQCSLFEKEQSTSARIVVNARDASILLD